MPRGAASRAAHTEGLGTLQDTLRVVLRVLTARAVQLTLQQLGDTDVLVHQWLNNFVAENNPMAGDDFVLALLSQVRCVSTGAARPSLCS